LYVYFLPFITMVFMLFSHPPLANNPIQQLKIH